MKLPKSLNAILQNVSTQFSNPKPNSILYNRWVLYFVFAISLFQLYTFSVAGKLQRIAVFLLVAFLTSFFSKNMTVIMVIALVFTEILNVGLNNSRLEGMTEGGEDKPTEESSSKDASAEPEDSKPNEKEEKDKLVKKDAPKEETPTPEKLIQKQDELKKNQEKIIQGFQEIEPYMNKAEALVSEINKVYAKK